MGNVVEKSIIEKLNKSFNITHLEVLNESHMHSVPANSETHFKVVIATKDFDGKRSVARHQLIYKELAEELAGPVHALALHTYTPSEWEERQQAPDSPNCLGGSKKEK